MIPHETLEIFSMVWWQSNIVTLSIILFLLILGKWFSPENRTQLGKFIGVILISRAVGIHFYWDYLGILTIESSLPLHLCGLSAILSGIVLFWRKQWAYECLFFWGIPGAFHSLLTPEFIFGTSGFLFYEYYLSHGGIILSAIYLTWVFGMKPRQGSWLKIFLYSQILLPFIAFINWIFNANYMFLCTKPIANNPFLIGEWPWYLLSIELAGLLHFFIIYLPFGLKYRTTKNKNVTPELN